jgi:hypothetical protein
VTCPESTGTATSTGTGTTTVTTTVVSTATGTATATGTTTITGTTTSTSTSTATRTTTCGGVFCDDFEDGSATDWSVFEGGASDFSVVVDGSHVYRESNYTSSWHISKAPAGPWADQVVEAKIKPLIFPGGSAAYMGIFGRYSGPAGSECGYFLGLTGDGQVALRKRQNGVDTTFGRTVCVGTSPDAWYTLKLEVVGTALKAYVNDSLVLVASDTSCTFGGVAVGGLGASFESDDVVVSSVTAPAPPPQDGGVDAGNTCLSNWRNTTCGAYCVNQGQADWKYCNVYLDCYLAHNCSPSTCGSQDDVCGVNVIDHYGTAPKNIADQVYSCLGCP